MLSRKSFKIVIATILISMLFFYIDTDAIVKILTRAQLKYIGVSLFTVLIIRLFMSLRWKIILDNNYIPISYGESLYITFVSNSIGFLLPGGIGVDLLKGNHAYKKNNNLSKVTTIVLLDRFIGVISMLFLVVVFSFVLIHTTNGGNEKLLRSVLYAAITIILTFFFSIYFFIKCKKIVKNKLATVRLFSKVVTKIYSMLDEVVICKRLAIKIFSISLLMQMLRSLTFYYIFKSILVNIDILYVLTYVPIIFILMLLPITIGGIGVRESAIFVLFKHFGVSLEQSVSSGILFYAVQLFMLLPGFLLYALIPKGKNCI